MKLVDKTVFPDADDIAVMTGSYSPRGDLIFGAGRLADQSGRVLVWDSRSLAQVASISTWGPDVTGLAISPDQRSLATCCFGTDRIDLWNVGEWSHRSTLKLLTEPYRRNAAGVLQDSTHVASMAFEPTGRLLAAGCWDMSLKVWDLADGRRTDLFEPHRNNVDFVAFMADGLLVTGTYQKLFVFEASSLGLKSQLKLPEAYSWRHIDLEGADGLLSISRNGQLRHWNTRNWSFQDFEISIGRSICSLAYSRRSELVAIGLESGEIVFWSPPARKSVGKKKVASDPVISLSFSPLEDSLCVVTAAPRERMARYRYEV